MLGGEEALILSKNYTDSKLKPVAKYIHDRNIEVQPTAFDKLTGTFTAPKHGLSNGDKIYTVINEGYYSFIAKNGIPLSKVNYVAESTSDTFKLADKDGNFNTYTNDIDFNCFRFEKNAPSNILISNLKPKSKYRVRVYGNNLEGVNFRVLPSHLYRDSWSVKEGTTLSYPNIIINPNESIFYIIDVWLEAIPLYTLKYEGYLLTGNNGITHVNQKMINYNITDTDLINQIELSGSRYPNGTTIEVYEV